MNEADRSLYSAEKRLSLPLPEMTFGNNSLILEYDPNAASSTAGPSHSASSVQFYSSSSAVKQKEVVKFDAMEALEGVATGEGWDDRVGGGVKVSMADQWSKSRCVGRLACGHILGKLELMVR